MPIAKRNQSRYPKNWTEIATEIKIKAGWTCQICGLQCLKKGEGETLTRSQKAKLTLTVHHIDHRPENNNPKNLIALCSSCHCRCHGGIYRGSIPINQLELF